MFFGDDPKAEGYEPPRLDDRMMHGIEFMIYTSRDARPVFKSLVIWMLRQTENLTKEVSLTLREEGGQHGWLKRVAEDFDTIAAGNGTTELSKYVSGMNTKMNLIGADGHFYRGEFKPLDNRYTLWWCYRAYTPHAARLEMPTFDVLLDILHESK